MFGLSLGALIGLFLISAVVALAVLWVAGLFFSAPTQTATTSKPESAFLFQGGLLIDSDTDILPDAKTWSDLRKWLDFRFDDLPDALPEAPDSKALTFTSTGTNASAMLNITPLTSATRVTLSDDATPDCANRHDFLRRKKTLSEQTTALRDAPYAICKTDPRGRILWQNAACTTIHKETDDDIKGLIGAFPDPGETKTTRIEVTHKDKSPSAWYEVFTTTIDRDFIHYATDITRVVKAEKVQHEFVQTLTKTFANLTIGLAIFDRNRQLALFNPALIDLTSLPAEFLSARPNLMSFFDDLRDRQVMPEPKNYADWRGQINHVIETASGGLYQETWALPSGVTYRVTGRPHPDGAVAFLFEDITAEISLTRRFRAQLDIRQSVLDTLDDAVAVIAPNNVVMFCNKACSQLLGIDPDSSFAEMSTRDLIAACNDKFPAAEFWHDLQSKINSKTLDQAPVGIVTSQSGTKLNCRAVPLTGGAVMLSLSAIPVHSPAPAELLPG